MKKITATSLCLFMLSACAGGGSQPEWVNQPNKAYPDQQYLHAVGEADNRDTSADRARGNLAKIFEVAVNDRSLDFSQASSVSEGQQTTTRNEQNSSRFVSSEAQQVLEGSEIAESWQNEQGRSYSLAVLNKSAAAKRFRMDIERADQQTRDLVAYADKQANTAVASLRALEQARKLQHKRDNSNRNLSIVGHKVYASNYPSATLEKMLRDNLSMLSFTLKSPEGNLDKELANAINRLGIQQAENSQYVLQALLDHDGVEKKQGWYWQRGSLVLTLSWKGEVIAKQRWPYKVSATDKSMVDQRSRDWVNQSLSKQLYELLTQPPANKTSH